MKATGLHLMVMFGFAETLQQLLCPATVSRVWPGKLWYCFVRFFRQEYHCSTHLACRDNLQDILRHKMQACLRDGGLKATARNGLKDHTSRQALTFFRVADAVFGGHNAL